MTVVVPLLVEQMRVALTSRDLDAFVDFFTEDYVGERPLHPGSPPSTREDVRANWAEVLADIPDLQVEILGAIQAGQTIWTEWRVYGMSESGAALELRGVFILGVRGAKIAWSRMYFEAVEQAGKPLAGLLSALTPPLHD
jgi:ketosteroid isomerase-like protein